MFAELEAAVIQFVASLVTEDAAEKLRLQPNGPFLHKIIPSLLLQLTSDITMTGPLLTAVAIKTPHEEIWRVLYNLIATSTIIQQPTPSITQTPVALTPADGGSDDDTLIIHNSASQEGDEQTRKLLDPRIWEEITQCTHRDVPEFFQKYFQGQESSQEADRIAGEAMSRYQGNGWVDFPKPPAQTLMLRWFFDLQHRFFGNQRLRFYTTHDTPLTGSQAKRKLDLLVQRNGDEASNVMRAKWKDICVIGELKETFYKDKDLIIQLVTSSMVSR
jgi:hypothetical protein